MRTLVREHAEQLEANGRLKELHRFRQHGKISVYDHSFGVALTALAIARKLKLKIDETSLVRGALLHDYFLYDWHIPEAGRPLHGFYHPKAALSNARKDFELSQREEDIIRHHMFPLTLRPPRTREGLLVCLADKVCAMKETFNRR